MNVTMRPATMQDDVFESKEEIAHTIKDELTKSMTGSRDKCVIRRAECVDG